MKSRLFVSLALSLLSASLLAAQVPDTIGGEKLVTLTRTPVSKTTPEFTSVTLMPGRGMQIYQITINYPGKGEIPVLVSPDLATVATKFDVEDTPYGDNGYWLGAAFLVPYANSIRGVPSPDGQTLTVTWNGRTITLPANLANKSGGGRHALHGLMLKSRATDVHVTHSSAGGQITGVIHAGDFGGHWLSRTDVDMAFTLTADTFDVSVIAHNVGKEAEPFAISWHPWFNIPSGDRAQARLHVPASTMMESDAATGAPTGRFIPVAGTRFDVQQADGVAFGADGYNANLSNLERESGVVAVKLIDPAAHYGISIESPTPEIKTIQIASTAGSHSVAIEDMYNLIDPFARQWGTTDTGMVTLQPGKSTKWEIRLHVFVP